MGFPGGVRGASQLQIIGDWKLLEEIGTGSFAKVFSAVNVKTGVQAAVKAVNGAKLTQKKLVDSLKTEVQIQRGINHPNIVRLLDYISSEVGPRGETQDTYYLVLEYCDGGDLASFLAARKRSGRQELDEATTRKLLRQLAMGLKEMHDLRIVHRDFKPANILLASTAADTCLKIADFGFARALAPALLAETLCGSPLYMAPEVLGEAPYDSRADLWSVGVIMFEMLTGYVPFMGNNIVHLKRVIDTTEAKLPPRMCEQLSPACQDLLRGLLQKAPSRRLSFEEFFKHPFLAGQPLLAPPPPGRLQAVTLQGSMEASSDGIEQDWLILDGPVDESSPAPHHDGGESVDGSADTAAEDDLVMQHQAALLPSRLTEEELLYGAVQRVAEISSWKTESGDFLSALSLQLLAVRLLDHLLAKLSGPRSPQTALERDRSSRSLSPAQPSASPSPRTHHNITPLPSHDTAAPPDAMMDVPLSSMHCPASDSPGVSAKGTPDSASGPSPVGHDMERSPREPSQGGGSAEATSKRQQLLSAARALFARLIHSTSSLANDLARRDRNFTIPCPLGLLWQGMLSIARSAGMDEMFGAYNKAVRGYAQAANLVWLLTARLGSSPLPRTPSTTLERISSSHSNARMSLPAVPEHSASGAACRLSHAEDEASESSSVSEGDECLQGGESSPLFALEATPRDGQQTPPACSDSGHDRALVNALQDAHQQEASLPPSGLLGWRLTEEQDILLRSYIGMLCQRHAACLHPPPR